MCRCISDCLASRSVQIYEPASDSIPVALTISPQTLLKAVDSMNDTIDNSHWHVRMLLHFLPLPNSFSRLVAGLTLLLCLENSFWRDSHNFKTAFKESWNIYIHSDTRKRVEEEISAVIPVDYQVDLTDLEDADPLTEDQKGEFFKIVCRNLLPRPETQLSV
ncbi:hypothetical protein FA15DRAFT_759212 [Coprinopsis marcescibilis]|uniref:Uncharacterized protein n=1 Tax=Coprinopsis marcescibilis TaxID=230819 RepID=A0A5C3KKD0_COPMA|nr:hypothetical protein FA15DRAFT_759212 [Coprinopsis marcescibilis]